MKSGTENGIRAWSKLRWPGKVSGHRRSVLFLWILLVWSSVVGPVEGQSFLSGRNGRVRTVNGGEWVGRLRWDGDQFVLANARSGTLVRFPLAQVTSMEWDRPDEDSLPNPNPANVEDADAGSDSSWEWSALGLKPERAGYQVQPSTLRLRSFGAGIGSGGEDAPFLHRYATGDFEIMGRLGSQTWTHPLAKSGLMVRSGLEPVAAMLFVGSTAQRGDVVEWRWEGNPEAELLPVTSAPYARWFKIKRRGDEWSVFRSRDAVRWTLLWQTNAVMPKRLAWGLAAAGKSDLKMHQAVWEGVRMGERIWRRAGVRAELRSGSVVEAPMVELVGDRFRFGGVQRRPEVRAAHLARIQFQPLPAGGQRALRFGIRGALLATGEFLEGEIQQLEGDRLILSSVLTGRRVLDADNQVAALVFGMPQATSAESVLKTTDGSEWRGTEVRIENGEWVMREPVLGRCRFPMGDVVEFRR